ncbi:MAG TPA: GntR family transcriptional regulator [Xanthobacteraceae bacterium]|nr:GntR family transcriptional regulator [Xanthobacteraceae bacterium]
MPLYIQVASVLRRRIETKQWHPGQKIPTLVELEQEFQVARVTVRQAVDILRKEGLLRSQQGRGTFTAEKSADRHWFKLATTWDVLIESIKNNVLKRIRVTDAPEFPVLRDGEGQLADRYVFQRSVQYKDAEPYGIVNLHLASDIYRRSPDAFRHHPALPIIAARKDVQIRHAHQTVVIGSADPTTSDLLRIALGAPTAECRCVLIDRHDVAIYVADIIYRSDAIQLHIDLLAHTRAASGNGRSPKTGKSKRAARASRLQRVSSQD